MTVRSLYAESTSRIVSSLLLAAPVGCGGEGATAPGALIDAKHDLLMLHYDHAPDRDDGQSAAADRTMLEVLLGAEWIRSHVIAVSGAYGENADQFNPASNAVMDAAWGDTGGWLAAHTDREGVVNLLAKRWISVLESGGDVWVKEGGQSDLTAGVVRQVREERSGLDLRRRVHVVQHSDWNEDQTTDADLAYVKDETDYIRIPDANAFLNIEGGNVAFEKAAVADIHFGSIWQTAFEYYPPSERLDFSDTGELMHILGLERIGINEYRERFLGP